MNGPTPAPLSPGARLGPHEVTGSLGAGGMGEVFRARDTRLGRDVAVKVLPPSFASDPERQRRFEQEARAVAALDHPNVLVVHDVGTHEGRPWIVTELLDGESLREKLREGRLPLRKAVGIAIQVARGLSAAHEKGIVHRDLKPENVFLTRDGRAKILDFGRARIDPLSIDRDAETQATPNEGTSPGMLLGTVAYMSPEQARGRPADVRSDVFALGAVLYEMLAGRRPFVGATPADTLSAILREDPPPIETGSGAAPPALDRVVRRCLEKEPSERFQSARDVGFALEALAQAADSTTSGTAAWGALAEAPRRRGVAARSLARALALVAAGAVVALGVRELLAPPPAPRIVKYRPLTGGSHGRIAALATDGERVYFTVRSRLETRQVALTGNASAPLTLPFSAGTVVDASKPRSSLLMVARRPEAGLRPADSVATGRGAWRRIRAVDPVRGAGTGLSLLGTLVSRRAGVRLQHGRRLLRLGLGCRGGDRGTRQPVRRLRAPEVAAMGETGDRAADIRASAHDEAPCSWRTAGASWSRAPTGAANCCASTPGRRDSGLCSGAFRAVSSTIPGMAGGSPGSRFASSLCGGAGRTAASRCS